VAGRIRSIDKIHPIGIIPRDKIRNDILREGIEISDFLLKLKVKDIRSCGNVKRKKKQKKSAEKGFTIKF
jgi:hypothetical protein